MSNELVAGFGGAILGAVVTSIFAWILQRGQEASRCKEELRGVMMALIDLRQKWENEIVPTVDYQARGAIEAFMGIKKTIYLEAAEVLVREVPSQVSSSEYVFLATEQMLSSNFRVAEHYFLRSIRTSGSLLPKILALRATAAFYFQPGPQTNFDKGRTYYQNALGELPDKASDPFSIFQLGYTYELLGWSELANGFHSEGHAAMDRARKYYRDLPNGYIYQNALAALDAKLTNVTQVPIASPTPSLAATPPSVDPSPLSPPPSGGPVASTDRS